MLIEFSVSNYRSISSTQSISMAAGSSSDVRRHYSFETGHRTVPYILKAVGIYGANGTGKSNIINAFSFMRMFVIGSAKDSQSGDAINVNSFAYDIDDGDGRSQFEIVFLSDGIRYQYGFVVDRHKVWEEWLYASPNEGRSQRWFERSYDESVGDYNWYINQNIKGQKEVWKTSTRENALFLSTAIQLNADYFLNAFSWFKMRLRVLQGSVDMTLHTARRCQSPEFSKKIVRFLNEIDIDVQDIRVDEREIPKSSLSIFTEDFKESLKKYTNSKMADIFFGRKNKSGKMVYLPIAEESDGTQRLFSMASAIIETLENGYILVIDEPSNNLHSLAFQHLISLFYRPDINRGSGQILFTSHEAGMMIHRLLHHDQIYLTEKDENFATQLFPLSSFKIRKNDAIHKAYLAGRYGGIPHIRSVEEYEE
ncbi:ATP-binding protein [Nitrospirillum sp. BR 11163]|uniref:AAA family ATPase n=1 Tax=Nitrospirillum sp. BR 11163 TaxID=3104323 RepID=UPI002AFF3103|nr:ATP-binding protein [Nitrospirillum sp. BR 11163]MEA1673471.1 ATP-binding protein [Nitrospirillum sp. BR 11163]